MCVGRKRRKGEGGREEQSEGETERKGETHE